MINYAKYITDNFTNSYNYGSLAILLKGIFGDDTEDCLEVAFRKLR